MFAHTTAAIAETNRHHDLEAAAARRRARGRGRAGRRQAGGGRESLAAVLRPPTTWPGAASPAPSR
jgi:hypothetical protein